MNNPPFFYCHGNNIFHSVQNIGLFSSTFSPAHPKKEIKGLGFYIRPLNIRQSVALYTARTLPKPTWLNTNNVYIGYSP
jgi:hypothetical protein